MSEWFSLIMDNIPKTKQDKTQTSPGFLNTERVKRGKGEESFEFCIKT